MRKLALAIGVIGVLALGLGAALSGRPAPRAALPERRGSRITDARSWGYQLQGPRTDRLADGIDVLVIDYSSDGSAGKVFAPAAVDAFRRRADGRSRIVLAYLSAGEAETYRYYWQPRWRQAPPAWLGVENTEWRGNYHVRYWAPEWQRIIVAPARTRLDALREIVDPARVPYIDRILEAGFDGVYLDRIDAWSDIGKGRPGAADDMIRFVAAISAYAKARKPGFMVVAQNGEELLQRADWRRNLDAVAKEDLFYGVAGAEQPNDADEVARSIRLLDRAKADRLPVFVVEYLSADPLRRAARARIAERGYIPLFATRELNAPPELLEPADEVRPATDRAPTRRVPQR